MESSQKPFLYTGQSIKGIPRNVTHVRVEPSVKVIGERAFEGCTQLIQVELWEGLEEIEGGAFKECTSLERIIVPSTVKKIGFYSFGGCTQLIDVKLPEGLEQIHENAFNGCTSLERIVVPSTVKEICYWAFMNCTRLRSVELCEGLEGISDRAFLNCTSLEWIIIPSTVEYIGVHAFKNCNHLRNIKLCEGLEGISDRAFEGCTLLERIIIPSTTYFIHRNAFRGSGLVEIEFCDTIEQFVNEVPLPLWNNGVLEARMYSFLARCNFRYILTRLDRLNLLTWKMNIHKILQSILVELADDKDKGDEDDDNNDIGKYNYDILFDEIESRLSIYEHLQDVIPFLELALWKAKIMEQSNANFIHVENDVKLMCRVNSFSMFAVIIPNVISFLVDE